MQNNSGLTPFCRQTSCFCIRVLVRPFVGDMFRNLMQTNSWLSWILVEWITQMHVVGVLQGKLHLHSPMPYRLELIKH